MYVCTPTHTHQHIHTHTPNARTGVGSCRQPRLRRCWWAWQLSALLRPILNKWVECVCYKICIYMYVYIYIRVYIYIYIYTYTYIYVYTHWGAVGGLGKWARALLCSIETSALDVYAIWLWRVDIYTCVYIYMYMYKGAVGGHGS